MRVGQKIMLVGLVIGVGGYFAVMATPTATPTAAAPSTYVDPVTAPVDDPTPDAPVLSAEDAAKQNDKGWVLESYRASGSDGSLINARVKNANATALTATFTLTLLNGTDPVAAYRGFVSKVEPDQVVTVQFATTDTLDPAAKGTFSFQFQTDVSYAG